MNLGTLGLEALSLEALGLAGTSNGSATKRTRIGRVELVEPGHDVS